MNALNRSTFAPSADARPWRSLAVTVLCAAALYSGSVSSAQVVVPRQMAGPALTADDLQKDSRLSRRIDLAI